MHCDAGDLRNSASASESYDADLAVLFRRHLRGKRFHFVQGALETGLPVRLRKHAHRTVDDGDLLRDFGRTICLDHGKRHDESKRYDRKNLKDEQQNILQPRDRVAFFLKTHAELPDIGTGNPLPLKIGLDEIDQKQGDKSQKSQKAQRH